MSDGNHEPPRSPGGFRIFRYEDSPQHKATVPTGVTEISGAGLSKVSEAGLGAGADTRVLYSAPGFNLVHVWFKSGWPLFRHSHGPDCLYYVIGGSLKIGDEELRKGDGFFVPGGVPYVYTVGPQGMELLEFRHEPIRDTDIQANNPAFWEKALEMVTSSQERWKTEPRPAG
jgi:hypothetical protein